MPVGESTRCTCDPYRSAFRAYYLEKRECLRAMPAGGIGKPDGNICFCPAFRFSQAGHGSVINTDSIVSAGFRQKVCSARACLKNAFREIAERIFQIRSRACPGHAQLPGCKLLMKGVRQSVL